MKRCGRCIGGTMLREYNPEEPREVCICCGYYEQNLVPLDLTGAPEREVFRSDTGKTHKQRTTGDGRHMRSRGVRL